MDSGNSPPVCALHAPASTVVLCDDEQRGSEIAAKISDKTLTNPVDA
jgi:hypothetical protein